MAIDTQNKRRSVMGYGGPWTVVAPVPDSSIVPPDWQHVVGLYSGITVGSGIVYTPATIVVGVGAAVIGVYEWIVGLLSSAIEAFAKPAESTETVYLQARTA